METLYIIYIIAVCLLGIVVGFFLTNSKLNHSIKIAKENMIKAAEIKAEAIKQEKIHQAKEKFFQLKTEHEKAINIKSQQLASLDHKAKQRDIELVKKNEEFNKKEKDLEQQKQHVAYQIDLYNKKNDELDKSTRRQIDQLEKISGLKADDAKQQMIETLKAEAKSDAMVYIKDTLEEAKISANLEAKKIIITSIQRLATETAIENSVSIFHIDNEEVKGRIIGREGRNIRTLEAATGVEIIVDDTPDAITLSCFDSIRREICRLALHQLVTDGRIHPTRIEEVVEKTKKMIEEEIIETGKRTAMDLGIQGLHPELLRMVGRMKYRSSYGQNLLQHSREVANLCAIMASELGLNPKIAKRAGLLHDIGKVPDTESEYPHAILGMKLAEKHKEKPEVCNAIGAHHDEIAMDNMYSPIIQVCDAISGSRPGVRREMTEQYMKRLKDLENLALNFKGVEKTYAIQAGRELRVVVASEVLDDKQSQQLAFDISQKIQTEMTYPGQVKVTVVREVRATAYAK